MNNITLILKLATAIELLKDHKISSTISNNLNQILVEMLERQGCPLHHDKLSYNDICRALIPEIK
jgi:hypothetical protein